MPLPMNRCPRWRVRSLARGRGSASPASPTNPRRGGSGQKLHDGVLRVCAPVLGSDESEMLADDLATIVGTEIPRDYDTLWKTRLARLKTLVDGRPVAVRDPSVGSETRHSSEVVLHSLRGFLYARARSGPLVLVFEDLHWAEQSLLELLERLTARGGEAPMLILCLARPDLLPSASPTPSRRGSCPAWTCSPRWRSG